MGPPGPIGERGEKVSGPNLNLNVFVCVCFCACVGVRVCVRVCECVCDSPLNLIIFPAILFDTLPSPNRPWKEGSLFLCSFARYP